MNDTQKYYLQSMGIDLWISRSGESGDAENKDSVNWDSLCQSVSSCVACELNKSRTQTVFGVGNQNADLLIIGEAPGAQEDRLGEPFVGRAGKLLDEMLFAIGLNREKVYIANILKCRPPNNRDPNPEEQQLCTPFLLQQISLLQPKLILAVGRIAAQYLLKSNLSLGRLRGTLHHYGEKKTPLIVSYHPAYLLRTPRDKSKAYSDLLTARELLDKSCITS